MTEKPKEEQSLTPDQINIMNEARKYLKEIYADFKLYNKLVERLKELESKIGRDKIRKYRLFHLAIGSTPVEKYIEGFDLEGGEIFKVIKETYAEKMNQ